MQLYLVSVYFDLESFLCQEVLTWVNMMKGSYKFPSFIIFDDLEVETVGEVLSRLNFAPNKALRWY